MTQSIQRCSDGAVSNTAIKSPLPANHLMAAKIDWLTITAQIQGSKRLDKYIETIQDYLSISIFFDNYRLNDDFSGRYKAYSGSLGCTFSYSNFNSDDVCNTRLTLPGEFLSNRKPWQIKKAMQKLHHNFGIKCSRIDLAVDDYKKQLNHKEIENSAKRGEGIGFNCGKTIDSYGTGNDGITVYCGSRRSPKFARFYQKGEFDRFEIEYKQQYASAIFNDYLADSSCGSVVLLSTILRSSISFAAKPDKNLSRSKELKWWTKFKNRIEGENIKVSYPKPKPSLDATFKWIHKSVSKSLLLMRQALGETIMSQTLEQWEYEARSRCTASDNDRLLQFNMRGFTTDELISMVQFS